MNRFFGGLNVLLAAVTATAMWAALNKRLENVDLKWQIVITAIAVMPAVSSGLQREWQISTREFGHLARMQECRQLQKELEFYLAVSPVDWREALNSWHQRYREAVSKPTSLGTA